MTDYTLGKYDRLVQVSAAFTPAAPINDMALFADRPHESMRCLDALFQHGLHVALYGERGVGKTSLANVLPKLVTGSRFNAVRVDCNTVDTYNSIWRKVFRKLHLPADFLTGDAPVDPEEVRFELEATGRKYFIVLDEFDRVEDDEGLSLLADTVKTFSDHGVDATLMFVGVASSVENLLGEHESIIRNVRQVPMPRMSRKELDALLTQAFGRVSQLNISEDAKSRIIYEAEGLPHFAHLLGLHSAQSAVSNDRSTVLVSDVEAAEEEATKTHSLLSEFRRATQSPQPDHLFEEVLLACAYAPRDGLGFFRAGDVRLPLSRIIGHDMGIPRFQRHLNEFAGGRQALEKVGRPRHYRYRFRNPLLQPFVKMAGRARGKISNELAHELGAAQLAQSEASFFESSSNGTEPLF